MIDKRGLSERDICTKLITPTLREARWAEMLQIHETATFTKNRIFVRGKLATIERGKRAYPIVNYKPNIPIAVVESKDNYLSVDIGMWQAIDCTETLHFPFAFSSPEWALHTTLRTANRR